MIEYDIYIIKSSYMIRINGHDCVSENYREMLYLIPLKYIWMAKIWQTSGDFGFPHETKKLGSVSSIYHCIKQKKCQTWRFHRAEGDATPNTHGDWNWSTWRQPEFFESNTHRNNSYIVKHGDGLGWDRDLAVSSLGATRVLAPNTSYKYWTNSIEITSYN